MSGSNSREVGEYWGWERAQVKKPRDSEGEVY